MRKLNIRHALFALVLAAPGCGGEDGNVFITLDYDTSNARFRVNEPIAPIAPVLNGSFFTNYVVDPALPAGLALNLANGEITGTPTAETPETSFVVSADFEGEMLVTTLVMAVGPQLPASFAEILRADPGRGLLTSFKNLLQRALRQPDADSA